DTERVDHKAVVATLFLPCASSRDEVFHKRRPKRVNTALLQDADSRALELWRERRDAFRRGLSAERFHRIDTAIEACDFDAALALLPGAAQPS
ncbi:MAG: hypothetical protein MK041_09305, partial [Aquabacterium sp.]|nr:hypothetical protein [Aquabacterium sp.]